MEEELREQFQMLIDMMGSMATKDDLKAVEPRLNIKLENEVSDKISSLFDGYQLTYEKQF